MLSPKSVVSFSSQMDIATRFSSESHSDIVAKEALSRVVTRSAVDPNSTRPENLFNSKCGPDLFRILSLFLLAYSADE